MNPLQTLTAEHRVIERVLDALEQYVHRSRTASVADTQWLSPSCLRMR